MLAVLIVVSGVLGLVFGSFLNVVIWRVPRGESVVSPASACPRCGHEIRWYDNVPIVSWIVLRGRCRDCGAPVSPRYLVVEAVTGAAFALVTTWWFLDRLPAHASVVAAVVELVAFLYLVAVSIALTAIDLDVFRLPNAIVLPSYAVLAVLLGAAALADGDAGAALRALIGGAALFAFYFLIAFIYPSGMGFGDVKLAGVLGLALAWVSWGALAVGAFAAFLLGGVFGVVLLLVRRAGRKSRIPFGPWMLGGAWIGIVVGDRVAAWYLALFGLV